MSYIPIILIICCIIAIFTSCCFHSWVRSRLDNIFNSFSTERENSITNVNPSINDLFDHEEKQSSTSSDDVSAPPIHIIPTTVGHKIDILEPNITIIFPN